MLELGLSLRSPSDGLGGRVGAGPSSKFMGTYDLGGGGLAGSGSSAIVNDCIDQMNSRPSAVLSNSDHAHKCYHKI